MLIFFWSTNLFLPNTFFKWNCSERGREIWNPDHLGLPEANSRTLAQNRWNTDKTYVFHSTESFCTNPDLSNRHHLTPKPLVTVLKYLSHEGYVHREGLFLCTCPKPMSGFLNTLMYLLPWQSKIIKSEVKILTHTSNCHKKQRFKHLFSESPLFHYKLSFRKKYYKMNDFLKKAFTGGVGQCTLSYALYDWSSHKSKILIA